MKNIKIYLITTITLAIVLVACNKEVANQQKNQALLSTSLSGLAISNMAISNCDKFAYADTIFYLKPQASDYIVKPLTPLSGTFGCFPTGLQIDAATGSINVTKSETGLEYMVWFIPGGTTDTCKKFITISGVNYNDGIYVMANNSFQAAPVYNANTLIPVICNGCEFDDGPDDDNGNGTADEPPAGQELIPQGFVINKSTGVIDFKKSIQNGVLGKNPLSGAFKEFTLNYRLGDKSNKALDHISFDLFYYKTQAEIPAKLKEDLSTKQGEILLENEDDDGHGGGHGGGGPGGGGHGGSRFTVVNSTAISAISAKNGKAETKCRPPYIIVTQN